MPFKIVECIACLGPELTHDANFLSQTAEGFGVIFAGQDEGMGIFTSLWRMSSRLK